MSYSYPHVALTSDNSNGYVASSSTTNFFTTFEAFDKDSSTRWVSSAEYDENGQYFGGASTLVSFPGSGTDIPIAGDWIQLQLPLSIVLTSINIKVFYNGTGPQSYMIVGSNTGNSWMYLDQYDTTSTSWTQHTHALSSTPSSYNYYRIIFITSYLDGGFNNTPIFIEEMSFNSDTAFGGGAPTLQGTNNVSYTYGSSSTAYAGSTTVVLNTLVTSNSSGALSFSIVSTTPSGCASIQTSGANKNLIFTEAGVVRIGVTQAANGLYDAITTPVEFDITLNRATTVVNVGSSPKVYTYGTSGTGYAGSTDVILSSLGITTNSNATLTFTKTVDANNSASLASSTLTFSKAGTVTIQVNQSQNNFYNALSPAPTFNVQLNRATTNINVGVSPKVYTYGISGTGYAGSTQLILSALISTNSDGTLTFTKQTDVGNIGSISGSTFTFTNSGTLIFQVSQAQSNFYAASSSNPTFTVTLNKGTQLLKFDKFTRINTDPPFAPSISTSANPSYNGLTFTVPANNGVVRTINGGTLLEILNLGRVIVSATQAGNNFYHPTSASARLTVKSEVIKSCYINLIDRATDSQEMVLANNLDAIKFEFPTTVNFRDYERQIYLYDIMNYFERVDILESDIDILETQRTGIESSIESLTSNRFNVIDTNLSILESRADDIDSRNFVLDERSDSILNRLVQNDTDLDQVETRISIVDSRTDTNETQISYLKNVRITEIESDINVLYERADSNLNRITNDDIELDVIETRISAVDSRTTESETNVSLLDVPFDQNESDIQILESRRISNVSRLEQDDISLDIIENRVSIVDSRTDTNETNIVELQNSFTLYESDVESVKGALFAITDGNLESTLSSLQQITAEFSTNHTTEDLVELQKRLASLQSIVEILTLVP